MQKEGKPEGGPGAEPGGGEREPEEGRVWPGDTGHSSGHHPPGEHSPSGMWGTPGMHSSFLTARQSHSLSLLKNVIINNSIIGAILCKCIAYMYVLIIVYNIHNVIII